MTAVQRYAPSVLSFLVLLLGGVQAAVAVGLSPVAVAQLVVLALTTAATWLVPLVGGRWRGKVKTGLELLGVAITLALPFIATGTITWADGLLVAVALIKALGAELGVQIRTDKPAPLPVQQVGDVHVVTSLSPADVEAAVVRGLDRVTGPDHRAE